MERETERLREVIQDLKFAYCGIHAPERINLMYAISTLESIEEAEFGTWIPCDVIMPEKDTSVFVSIKEGSESYTNVAYRTDDGCGWYDNEQMSFYKNEDVIAWMPLPEPYKRNLNGKWLNSEYKVSDDDKLLESAKQICKIAKIKSFDDLGEKQSEEIILGLLKTVLGVNE